MPASHEVVIRQPRSYLAVIVLLVSALVATLEAALRHGTLAGADLRLPLGFALAALLCSWLAFVQGKREVRIDGRAGEVTVSRSTWLFRRKTQTWPLAQFDAVRSCLRTTQTSTFSVLELISGTGMDPVELACYRSGRGRPSRLVPYPGEAPEVRQLRLEIADKFGLHDAGFDGDSLSAQAR